MMKHDINEIKVNSYVRNIIIIIQMRLCWAKYIEITFIRHKNIKKNSNLSSSFYFCGNEIECVF